MAPLAALPDCDYRSRSERLRTRLDGRTMVVSNPSNIRWLTGFGGSLGWVVIAPERTTLVTDGRYEARAATDIDTAGIDAEVIAGRTRADVTALVVAAAAGAAPVLGEADHLTHAAWLALAADLDLEPSGPVVQELRRVKDAGEVARMALAASIADRALVDTAPVLAQRPSEADVRDALESRMRALDADGPSYATIVASGPTFAARPHHETGRRTIVEGDTVIIDVGALVDGYHSDMTRSFVVGEPTPEQLDVYACVREAQAAGLATVRAGVGAADIDAACRAVFRAAGREDWYLHGTGHGVGLDIHEEPFSSPVSTATLLEGDVVTVEPGLYRDGFGGVRIEDLVSVTATGCSPLTHLPKDAPCLPSPPTT